MIQFTVQKTILEKAMSKLDVIIPTRDTQTLLSNVLITVLKETIEITASDMESAAKITIPVTNTKAGELIVKARKLSQISKQSSAEELTFVATLTENEEDDDVANRYSVSVSGNESHSARFKISGSHRSQFPQLNIISEDKLSKIPSALLNEMIKKTVYAISQEDNRYIYNGLCFHANGNELTLVGTDGRRLSAITRTLDTPIQLAVSEGDLSNIVLHAKAIRELECILDSDEEVLLGVEQRDIFFKVGQSELSSRLLEGKFPDYKKVIPPNPDIKLEISKKALLDGIKEVMVMTEPPSFQIRMLIKSGEMLIKANTPDVGEADVKLAVNYKGESIEVCYNASYCMDILKSIKSETIRIEIKDENKPILIYDLEDDHFIALIMPMRA